jgi:hypothetical protein
MVNIESRKILFRLWIQDSVVFKECEKYEVREFGSAASGQWHKVRSYLWKGDETCMGRMTEITVCATSAPNVAPRCTATHVALWWRSRSAGTPGNIFHDFSDVLVPLYTAAAQKYRGDVQLVMTNVVSWWLVKYGRLLRAVAARGPRRRQGWRGRGDALLPPRRGRPPRAPGACRRRARHA